MLHKRLIRFLGMLVILFLLASCNIDNKKQEITDSENKTTMEIIKTNENVIDENIDDSSINKNTKFDEFDFVRKLLEAIKLKDINSFTKMLPVEENVLVARSFSSGNGKRGRNITKNVSAESFSKDICIDVEGETPIELEFLLQQSLKDGIETIQDEEVDEIINFSEINSTQDVWDKCSDILYKLKDEDWKPRLLRLRDNQFALYEGGYVMGFPVGGWVVFEKKDEGFHLMGIFDLR